MNTAIRLILPLTLAMLMFAPATSAAESTATAPAAPPAAGPAPLPELPEVQDVLQSDGDGREDSNIVAVGQDAALPAGEHADAVVAVFGSATSAGDVSEAVVSVLGNTRVTGPVGEDAVAVFGSTYVNSRIGGDVVAVFGNVELGPEADVGGDLVAVGGTVTRHPQSRVSGTTNNVMTGWTAGNFDGLRTWMRACALYARPLAFVSGIGWAWGIALGFLVLYVLIALLFRRGIDDCVQTLRSRPGQSVLASLLTLLGIPVLMMILVITIVGIAVLPFVGIGLFLAALFGKAVMLAWIGGACLAPLRRHDASGDESRATDVLAHPALAVLLGGAIVLALYTVPVLGIILYKLLGVLGLGAVVFTVILSLRSARDARRAAVTLAVPAPAMSAPAMAVTDGPAATAPAVATPAVATPLAQLSLPRAGFWPRMAALAIDGVLIAVVVSLIVDSSRLTLLALAVYGAVMWKLRGTTVGGSILGLQLVRTDGRDIDWATAIVRALGCFVSLIALGLGFIWIAFNDERQAWHDRIAGTVVVRSAKGAPLL